MRLLVVPLLLLTAPLAAQRPQFRGGIGLSVGRYDFDSDLAGFDDDASAALFLAELEVTSPRGYGGGFRFERYRTDSDDGLFPPPGDPFNRGAQATSSSLFGHFTYRLQQHRFEMPVRFGLMFHGLNLDDRLGPDSETDYASFGPMFEVEPEVTIARADSFRWSAYGQLGFGVAATAIDVDGDPADFDSSSGFFNVELGTRVGVGAAEFGLAFVGRYQSMDPSDIESGRFVPGFGAGYEGVMLTVGFRF